MTRTRRRPVRSLLAAVASAATLIATIAIAPGAAAASSSYTVSGTITYSVPGGAAQPYGFVRLYPVAGTPAPAGGSYITTTSGGAWSIGGVAPGRYRVRADATLPDSAANAAIWYGDTPFEDDATVVTVDRNVTGLHFTQPAAGSISGTLTAPPGSTSFNGLEAWLLNPVTGLFERPTGVASWGGGSYSIRGLAPGKYVVRFADQSYGQPEVSTQYYKDAGDLWDSQLVTVGPGEDVTGIDGTVGAWSWYSGRIAGADRYATSAAVSAASFLAGTTAGTGPVVHVANGLNFPDALSASAAAAAAGGPLLLTAPGGVPGTILTELRRLKPEKIVVVGGASVVSSHVVAQLQTLTPKVTRVAGSDRYATSRAIVGSAFPKGPVTSVFVATGRNFPDALVAGSAAGYQYGPLLLIDGRGAHLDAATKSLLSSLSPGRIYVVGGTASVSAGIQSDLEKLGAPEVVRLAGQDRFGTAQAVNREVFPFADMAFVASASGFPDALSASAVAGVLGAPLILAPPSCIPYTAFVDSTRLGVSDYWAVGGTGVLSAAITNITYCPPGIYGSAAVGPTAATGSAAKPADPKAADPSQLAVASKAHAAARQNRR